MAGIGYAYNSKASPPALPRREGAGRRKGNLLKIHFQYLTAIFHFSNLFWGLAFEHSGSLPTGEGGGRGRSLYYRQTRAVNLLIEIESEDIGHATDEINDCHEAGFEIVGVDVVLAADTT